MANSYFKFKQFIVNQDECAMKVGTDGVLLGSWANVYGSKNALDIGTGTGLIALMLAQRNTNLIITAIDIDDTAIRQSKDNFLNSTFSKRIKCEHISAACFANKIQNKFDLIVSNPPYFNNSLKSPDSQRTLARHTDSLPIQNLFDVVSKLLSQSGKFSIIYPYEAKEHLISLAEKFKLHPVRITNVYPTPTSNPKRVLMELSPQKTNRIESCLIIETERHMYSPEFIELVKDFYLKY